MNIDLLLPENIVPELDRFSLGTPYYYLDEIGSTNDYCTGLAKDGAPEGTLVVASRQLKGRGRRGRRWVSPPGGLYLSLLLRPRFEVKKAALLPLAAGVAVAETLETCGLTPQLKWPNDILVENKKLCGILVESGFSGTELLYSIAGIGINIAIETGTLPPELTAKTASLSGILDKPPEPSEVLVSLIGHLERLYRLLEQGPTDTILNEYRNRSAVLGKELTVDAPEGRLRGRAVAINDSGALVIDSAGAQHTILTGTILAFN